MEIVTLFPQTVIHPVLDSNTLTLQEDPRTIVYCAVPKQAANQQPDEHVIPTINRTPMSLNRDNPSSQQFSTSPGRYTSSHPFSSWSHVVMVVLLTIRALPPISIKKSHTILSGIRWGLW